MLLQNFSDPTTSLFKDFKYEQNGNKTFNNNFGYPSILPLAFGMIDEDSLYFNETLNAIKDLLDGGSGLTSISMKSRYYL